MANYMKKILVVCCCIAAIALQNCTETTETAQSFTPPNKSLDAAPSNFEFLAEEGKTIQLANGGSLEIPENAFVDEQGNPIKGKVEISYREFHSAPAIITSGIPMVYEENGQQYQFQTAGMFEINGYLASPKTAQLFGKSKKEKGKPVFINKSKKVKVNMASFTGEQDYNFYFLNEGKWEEVKKSEAKPNSIKLEKVEKEAPLPAEPKAPEKHNPKKPVFELDINTNDFPELAHFEGIMWQFAGNNKAEDPANPSNSWLAKVQWSDITVKPNQNEEGLYRMTLSSKDKKFAMDVSPVLNGRNYQKALKKFNKSLAKFEAAKEKRKKVEQRLANEASFIRTASISRFGVYNHDRYYNQQDAVTFAASFQLDNNESFPDDATVFLVTGQSRTIIKYPKSTWAKFKVVPTDQNKLVTILSDGQVAVFNSQDFQNMQLANKQQQLFRMKVVNDINSFDALENLMAKL